MPDSSAIAPQFSPNRSPQPLDYQVYRDVGNAGAVVHAVRVSVDGGWQVQPWLGDGLKPLPAWVQQAESEGVEVAAAINGGFFDPANQLTTSYAVRDRHLVADPRTNPRLMENPDLQPYLPAILDRSEFRVYDCGGSVRYGIAHHQDAPPAGCEIEHSLGAGPRLLPQLTDEAEGFWRTENGQVVRDAIGRDRPNARSAIGLTAQDDIMLVMVERPGLTLPELAAFLQRLGVVDALNLDGGSSSGLWVAGRAIAGTQDEAGNPQWRPIHSVWGVSPAAP